MTGAQPDGHDVTKKSHVAILKSEIDEGAKQFERTGSGLFLSGLSAGLDVGFSVLVLAVVIRRRSAMRRSPRPSPSC